MGWLKTHCAGQTVGKGFTKVADTAKYCHSLGKQCQGVYDDSCDGKGTFYACNTNKLQSSGMGSCVHKAETWQKWSNQHCSGQSIKSFSNAADAMKYCADVGPKTCSGVYDDSCDGKGTFYACNTKGYSKSAMGSCVYRIPKSGSDVTPAPTSWGKLPNMHCSGSSS